jgi:hypothetical protein
MTIFGNVAGISLHVGILFLGYIMELGGAERSKNDQMQAIGAG